jgi:enoyl-CoA hydratase/carnithine racemase
MQLENIILNKQQHVATITINHPPVNAWNWATMQDFERALDAVENDSNVRVVIITGAGEKCFASTASRNRSLPLSTAMPWVAAWNWPCAVNSG